MVKIKITFSKNSLQNEEKLFAKFEHDFKSTMSPTCRLSGDSFPVLTYFYSNEKEGLGEIM